MGIPRVVGFIFPQRGRVTIPQEARRDDAAAVGPGLPVEEEGAPEVEDEGDECSDDDSSDEGHDDDDGVGAATLAGASGGAAT